MKLKQYITAGCLLAAMGLMLPSCMDLEPKAEMADNMVWNKAENFQLFANQYYGFSRTTAAGSTTVPKLSTATTAPTFWQPRR